MARLSRGEFNKNPRLAYLGFLFQTFLKRPFGYIIGVLYVFYLSVILLIVPAAIHQDPLFIWGMSAFNISIFNLFFIAAATSSMAVAIFRVGREDGTDLLLSAKPLTKKDTIALKTIVYLLIMLIFCVAVLLIISLILPIFGIYDYDTNPLGITMAKYTGILLSSFIGNIVNMFLFGAIAIFISMVGGQVITMIGTIAVAFVFCMMNFIYPQIITSPYDYVNQKYNTDILSYRANTLNQYENNDESTEQFSFASVQCFTDDNFDLTIDVDTNVAWNEAMKLSSAALINYIDFGKQLSQLYQGFGLETMRVDDAKELLIGINTNFDYTILPETHVVDHTFDKQYPICIYEQNASQGKIYPTVRILGGNVGQLKLNNWYIYSRLAQVDPSSVCVASTSLSGFSIITNNSDRQKFNNKPFLLMNEARDLSEQQKNLAKQWWDEYLQIDFSQEELLKQPMFLSYKMQTPEGQAVFYPTTTWDELIENNKWKTIFDLITRVHLYWAILAHNEQIELIQQFFHSSVDVAFPYTSKQLNEWFTNAVDDQKELKIKQRNMTYVYDYCFQLDEDIPYYSCLPNSELSYAETFNNLYKYDVSNFYSIYTIIACWSIISIILLATSIIVYKRTDFK